MSDLSSLRNFCVISHIDHGKTTLTDRLLEQTGTVAKRDSTERMLDSNPIEKERGITIKLAPARMHYMLHATRYVLNLIDTPGHVDFSYEVSRSLTACEGALLLVDATQGIQAQTIANAYLALDHNLTIIPVINKIDLPSAQIDQVEQDLIDTFGFKKGEMIHISAKTGLNVDKLLQAIVERIPPPQGAPSGALTALVFNSHFDQHKGVIVAVRIVDGALNTQDQIHFMATHTNVPAVEVGYFTPQLIPTTMLKTGEVGYIATGLKDVSLAKVGDTITHKLNPAQAPLPGYQEPKPMVFMELYPVDGQDFLALKDAASKLELNDAALTYEGTSSPALGHGIRMGFLGLLHAEVVQERLEREFDLELIATTPTVRHMVTRTNGAVEEITSAADFPDPSAIKETAEPYIKLTIFVPHEYVGDVIQVTQAHRATLTNQTYFGPRVCLSYDMPLSELISGYYDDLKSASAGYASLDYALADFRPVEAVKLDILIHHQSVAPLASIVVKSQAEARGRQIVAKLKEVLPRQSFEMPIQATIGGTIIARETIKAFRKDVTAKLYGGDQTRKDKLLKKQKKGKKRMKQLGRVQIPQEAFLAVLKK